MNESRTADDLRAFRETCEREFALVHHKLDQLDEAIRGNGTPGIKVRLDRLEQKERSRSRLLWLITGAAVTLAASNVWAHVFGG